MPNEPQSLRFYSFSCNNPLESLRSLQSSYLTDYLSSIDAVSIVEEPSYFDRDYLDEFATYYSVSSFGYPNICRRLHFFSVSVDRARLRRAIGGSQRVWRMLQDAYLGFSVIRPIPSAPLGRTVLRWFPDPLEQTTPRVIEPSRTYRVHIAGMPLDVHGIAWQQQDSGVGGCATIALWTMLHSSALDDHHAIPTTARITKAAHLRTAHGRRTFPSSGLSAIEMREAIKNLGFSPMVATGDPSLQVLKPYLGGQVPFPRDRFTNLLTSLIRSRYPVLIAGVVLRDGAAVDLHAVTAVGFRSSNELLAKPGDVVCQDEGVSHIYLHDDNFGPGMRWKITERKFGTQPHASAGNGNGRSANGGIGSNSLRCAELVVDPPANVRADYIGDSPYSLVPVNLIVAANDEVRVPVDRLYEEAFRAGTKGCERLNTLLESTGKQQIGMTFSVRIMKLAEYLGFGLQSVIDDQNIMAHTRLRLIERIRPMSLFVGVLRFGMSPSSTPLFDALIDTTFTEQSLPTFCGVCFQAAGEVAFQLAFDSDSVVHAYAERQGLSA